MPGFAVFFEAHLFGFAVGVEVEQGSGSADFYRDDVPDVEGDYVGRDEVDVAFGIDGAAFADGVGGADFVAVVADRIGAFDLDAEEVDLLRQAQDRLSAWLGAGSRDRAVVEDEVVALAVSPGLADGEAALAGLVEEGGFGALSAALGVGAGRVVGRAGRRALGHERLLRLAGTIKERKGGACGAPPSFTRLLLNIS